MYIRFVVGSDGEDYRWLSGIITEGRLLRDRGKLERHQEIWLEETYEWLNEHLPCPPFRASGWGGEAASWFKDDAKLPIRKMWEIVTLLQEQGVAIRVLRSRKPGKILYEDDYQVLVKEWKRL